jgi:uncharacterized protein (DUF885 family)
VERTQGGERTSASNTAREPDREFRAYLADDWSRWLSEAPETATVVGVPGYNDRWTDDSTEGIETRRKHLTATARRFQEFRSEDLSPREQLNHALYRKLLENAEQAASFGADAYPFTTGWPRYLSTPLHQMDGIHLTVGQLIPLQPRVSVRDYEDILARLRAVPAFVDQEIGLLRAALARGVTAPRAAVHGVPDQIASLVPEDPGKSTLLEPFREFPVSVPEADRPRLVSEATGAYADAARPAFLRLHEFVTQEYLPKCRSSIAASDLPNGEAYYRFLVRWTTTLDLTPEEVHAIGLAEVQRIRTEMDAVMRSTGFAGSVEEFHRFLRTDPRFFYSRPEDLVDGYRVIAKRIDPELAHHFGRLPRTPYGVLPVPDFSAPSSPAAYYINGSPESGRAGYFFANSYDLSSRPRWRMEPLTLHEAVPGHHLQLAIASEIEDVPDFRRFSGGTAFVEGWGLYAEGLGEELGLYRDPYSKYGALGFDIWRSIRLVVDTGMHAMGWSRERAIEFFREHTGMSDLDITVEVDRYIVIPGQALAYKIGQRKFRELRRYAEETLGPEFDERTFHDRVLEEGALPLGELDHRIRAWVDSERARHSRPVAR